MVTKDTNKTKTKSAGKPKTAAKPSGYIDITKQYGIPQFTEEYINKAMELNKQYPGSKFVCTANGCADIASQAASAMGHNFGKANAWEYGNRSDIVFTNPAYSQELQNPNGPLHNPTSFNVPKQFLGMENVLVGLNRKNNLVDAQGNKVGNVPNAQQIAAATSRAQANDSIDYANQDLYEGSRGYEHIGYMLGKNTLLHGTAASKDHPAFFVIDDMSNGVDLAGYGQYEPVEAIAEPTNMQAIGNKFKSAGNRVSDWLFGEPSSTKAASSNIIKKENGGWLDKFDKGGKASKYIQNVPKTFGKGVAKIDETRQSPALNYRSVEDSQRIALAKEMARRQTYFNPQGTPISSTRRESIEELAAQEKASAFSRMIAEGAQTLGAGLELISPFTGIAAPAVAATGAGLGMGSSAYLAGKEALAGNYGDAALNVGFGALDAAGLIALRNPMVKDFIKGADHVSDYSQVVDLTGVASSLDDKIFKNSLGIDWAKWNKEIPSNKPLMQEYKAIEETSKANGTWMKNADGSAFTGTPEQFVQQQSSNFKKAFPQGATKFYRGSNQHIDDFVKRQRPDWALFGSDDINVAKGYANNTEGPVNFYTPETSTEWGEKGLYELAFPNEAKIIEGQGGGRDFGLLDYNEQVAKGTRNPRMVANHNENLRYNWNNGNQYNYTKDMYDPARTYIDTDSYANYVKNTNNPETVAKMNNVIDGPKDLSATIYAIDAERTPIKSLRGNNGMFDMSNSNIYKSIAPIVGAGAAASQFVDQKKNGGWLEKYNDGGPVQPNYNDASVSMSEDFVGDGYSNVGRNYSPAWGGQFKDGGPVKRFMQPTETFKNIGYNPKEKGLSTEYSTSIGGPGEVYLVPGYRQGRLLNDPEATFNMYGEHLGGPFKTVKAAEDFAQLRHKYVEQNKNIPAPFKTRDYAMGGSIGGATQGIPGATGFMYARTGSTPDNGKYAKKTKASAADGIRLMEGEETQPVKTSTVKSEERKKAQEKIMDRAPLDIIEEGRSKFRFNMLQDAVKHDMAMEQGVGLDDINQKDLKKKTMELLLKRESKLSNPTVEFVKGNGTVEDVPGGGFILGYYDPTNKNALVSLSDNLDQFDVSKFEGTTRHEFRHAYDDGGEYLTNYEKELIGRKTNTDNVEKQKAIGIDRYEYLKDPTEVTARLQDIRGALKDNPRTTGFLKKDKDATFNLYNKVDKEGYYLDDFSNQRIPTKKTYDPRKDKATYEDLYYLNEKTKNSGLQDLLKVMKTEDIVDLLNTIATNNPQQGMPMAQNGAEMKFYQEGLDFKPKSISRDGSQLTKLDQLSNFTNYNTKQPGGWLDKYQ